MSPEEKLTVSSGFWLCTGGRDLKHLQLFCYHTTDVYAEWYWQHMQTAKSHILCWTSSGVWLSNLVTIIFSESSTNKTSNIFRMIFLPLHFYILEFFSSSIAKVQMPTKITQPTEPVELKKPPGWDVKHLQDHKSSCPSSTCSNYRILFDRNYYKDCHIFCQGLLHPTDMWYNIMPEKKPCSGISRSRCSGQVQKAATSWSTCPFEISFQPEPINCYWLV